MMPHPPRPPRIFFTAGRCAGVVFATLLSLAAHAAPLHLDLGDGLAYFRVHALPSDLPPPTAQTGPLVLDLRFAKADDGAATALDAWLKFRASAAHPVFVLLDAETARPLLDVLRTNEGAGGLVTLGLPAAGYMPDIAIKTTEQADKAAFDALEHGGSLPALITENADKVRADEASLAREKSSPTEDDEEDDSIGFEAPHPAAKPTPPPPVVDLVLQRAVHLHRALRALKRL